MKMCKAGCIQAAIAKAIEIRDQSLSVYETAATKARRRDAQALKKSLAAARSSS